MHWEKSSRDIPLKQCFDWNNTLGQFIRGTKVRKLLLKSTYLSAPNDLDYCGKKYILDKGAYLWFFPYSLPSGFLVFMKNTIGITNLRK